jgi:acyl dehydratase
MRLGVRDLPPVAANAASSLDHLVGVPLRRRGLSTEVTVQSIRRWAVAIGERNPLYLQVDHGRNSRWGSMIAPPLWLYTVDDTVIDPGLAGLHSLYVGVEWEFFGPLRVGAAIASVARLTRVGERESRFAGSTITQTGEVLYSTPEGRQVARAVSRIDRFSRSAAAGRGLYTKVRKYRYTEDELLAIEDAYDAEQIRGDQVRYWEDTQPGEEIPQVVKGPLSSEDIITFVCATSPVRTYGTQIRYRQRHPLSEFLDEQTGRYDAWERALLDPEVAQKFGFPLPHDVGYQRVCWLASMLSNWGGDDSQLVKLSVDLVLPNFHGDSTFCRGRVSERSKRNGVGTVKCDIWCENQRGERSAIGSAEVSLQSRTV